MNDTTNMTACAPYNLSCMTTDQAYYVLMDYIFPDFYEWIFISLFLLVFIFGIVGNILVFYAVWSNVQLRNATNFFLVNLSIADFMVLFICLPPTVIHDVAQTWFLGEILCKLISYLQVSISLFSNLMVTSNPFYHKTCGLYSTTPYFYRIPHNSLKTGIF
jgi:hypothetical protein